VANVSSSKGMVKRDRKADCDSNETYSFDGNHASLVAGHADFFRTRVLKTLGRPTLPLVSTDTRLQLKLISSTSRWSYEKLAIARTNQAGKAFLASQDMKPLAHWRAGGLIVVSV
jgi:hypothetical protein